MGYNPSKHSDFVELWLFFLDGNCAISLFKQTTHPYTLLNMKGFVKVANYLKHFHFAKCTCTAKKYGTQQTKLEMGYLGLGSFVVLAYILVFSKVFQF